MELSPPGRSCQGRRFPGSRWLPYDSTPRSPTVMSASRMSGWEQATLTVALSGMKLSFAFSSGTAFTVPNSA